MEILKICAVGLICAASCLLLRGFNREYSVVFSALCAVMIITLSFGGIRETVDFISSFNYGDFQSGLLSSMLKAVGVMLICELSADVCERSGESVLAKTITIAGKIEIILIALPLIRTITDTAAKLSI